MAVTKAHAVRGKDDPQRSCFRNKSATVFGTVVFQHLAGIFGVQAGLFGCVVRLCKTVAVSAALSQTADAA